MRTRTMSLALLAVLISLPLAAETFSVRPEDAVIILPADMEARSKLARLIIPLAAEELQYHLKLVTGKQTGIVKDDEAPEGAYRLNVGMIPPDEDVKLATGEARWRVNRDAA